MDTKKYGVSLSALKSLKDFQLSVRNKQSKIMPLVVNCFFSLNNEEPYRCSIVADTGLVSSEIFGVIFLKNRVACTTETNTSVIFEGKGRSRFTKMSLEFDSRGDKDAFMNTIQNVIISSDSDSRSSADSVLQ